MKWAIRKLWISKFKLMRPIKVGYTFGTTTNTSIKAKTFENTFCAFFNS
ncbi:hypothetical protein ZONE111905_04860 [Zobellia nedashkovskayae]